MAKKVLLDTYYTFSPSTDTVVIPRVIQRENLMLITNVTTNQVIYNFSDPELSALSYTVRGSSTVSTTTIVLNYDCSQMLSTDKLQIIYDEYDEKITPSDNLVDAVAKMRVAAPQSLIDTDFEYGVQGSKWEALALTNNYPSFFSKGSGGNSLEISDAVSNGGLTVRDKSRISVLTVSAHGLTSNDVISVQESLDENADGTYPVTVPLQLSLSVATTGIFTTQGNLAHNLVANQPIIFSSVGTAVGISADTKYYVTFTGLTTTTAYQFKLKAAIDSTSTVTISTADTANGVKTDNTKLFYYLAKSRVASGSIKDDILTSMVPGGIFDNAHIPGGITGSLDRFSIATSAGGTTGILNAETTISTPDPHGLVPGTPILINGVLYSGETTVTNKVLSSNVATLTTSTAHEYFAGDTVNISGVDSTFNGQYSVKEIGAITNKVMNSSGVATLTSAGHPFQINDVVNISGVDDTFNGTEIVITAIATNTFSYSIPGGTAITSASVSPSGSAIYSTKISYDKTSGDVTSASSSGLIGNVGNGTTNDFATNINGSWIVTSIPSPTTFSFIRSGTTKAFPTGDVNSSAILVCKPDAYIKHTSSNGGVELATVNNVTGIKQIRQTRKTFRYQSGKAIQFSTGAKFTPSYDINSISSDVSSGATTISVTTVQDHGMQPGARVKIEGIQVVGGDFNPFNGDFLVTDVINQNTFAYKTTITPGFTYTTNMNPSGENSIVTVSTWAGACTRVGLFNEMNGIFFEYDGQKLWACKRSSNKPLYGTITVNNKGNLVTGTDTRFTKQLVAQDAVVIKGQVYQVISVLSDTAIRISPAYRGQTISTSAKIYKVQTIRVPQNEFNLDRLDGTGPSGYILDPTKMQMVYIDYTWYGSGFIRFGMRMTNGDIMYCHRMPNNNINTQSYMRSGNLPARYEVHNYAPRTRLVAGSSTINGVPLSNDSSGAVLPTTGTVMYVEDVTGWRTTAPTGVDGDPIGYAIIEKQGDSPQSEIVTYTKVGSFNTTVGGYPITIQRDKTQLLITGGYDGSGTITTSISGATVTGVGTTDLSGIEAGDILYLANGIRLGVAQNNGVAASGPNPSTVLLTATPPANPIPAQNGSPQGYTDENFKVVKIRQLSSGNGDAQEFSPDSSIAGSLYQQLSVTANGTDSLTTGSVNLNSRIAVNTKVEVIDAGATNLVVGGIYYVASGTSFNGTTLKITDAQNGTAISVTTGTATLLFFQPEQVSVRVITQTCAPSLTHWGSSVIMDGGYDEDRGIQFNTRMKRYLRIAANESRPVMSLRIAPSVDNGIGRNFGKREVVNTMQLVLQQVEALGTGPFLIEGILNPTTVNHTGSGTAIVNNPALVYPTDWEKFNIGSGSLAQIIFHDNTGVLGTSTATYTPVTATGTYSGGDTIFSFYTDNSGGSSNPSVTRFDLDTIRELGTSILSGNGSTTTPGFPNGPDVLTIVVTNLGSSGTADVNVRMSWTEAQA
jgi:hypothetical protein